MYLVNGLHACDLIKVHLAGLDGHIKGSFKGVLAFRKVFNEVSVTLAVHIQSELDISVDIQTIEEATANNLKDKADRKHHLVLPT